MQSSPLLPFRLVYSEGYDLNLGDHVFPSRKYRLVKERLVAFGIAQPQDFVSPPPATDDQISLVHQPDWIGKLKEGRLTEQEIRTLEIPFSPQMVNAVWLATGGTILAARLARENGFSCNLAGGFHHAFPGHGEGFCAIHDVAVAIRTLQREGAIAKAFVADCDVHHGNGTAAIFAKDESVFTYSIHQWNNYPLLKPPSDLDVNLPDGMGDSEYLEKLESTLLPALDRFQPDLICYVAGADPYFDDQLGGLHLSMKGLLQRDDLVLNAARTRGIPIVATLAGGYARITSDTITIHANLVASARDAWSAD